MLNGSTKSAVATVLVWAAGVRTVLDLVKRVR
jgi:hypothetical protein